jgi:prolyl oligopeptidase
MPANRLPISLSVCLFTLSALAQGPPIPKPPDTPRHAVTDEYQGVKVTDDYRWLENWDDPGVKQWSAVENARTREYLDQVPARDSIKNRLRQLATARSMTYSGLQFRAGMLFAEKHQPPLQQPLLVAMRFPDDPASARVIFDPNAASAKGSLAVDFFVPSFGGKYVAAALSQNGSEDAVAHVFEVATGKQLRDVVPRVNFATAGGSIAWKPDSSGFYYTRYPQGNERPPEDANFFQQVYFHKLGTDPAQDTYVLGKDFPRIAEIQLHTSDDGRWLLASVGNGDGGQFAHYLMDSEGHWTQLTHFEDGITAVKFGADPALYLLSRKDAPRGQILRLPISRLDLNQAKVVVPQSAGAPPRPTVLPSKISCPPGDASTSSTSWAGRRACASLSRSYLTAFPVDPFQGSAQGEKSRCLRSPPSDKSSLLAEVMCSSTFPRFSSHRFCIALMLPPEAQLVSSRQRRSLPSNSTTRK